MKKLKRIMVLSIVLLVAMNMLTGCGKTGSSNSSSSNVSTNETTSASMAAQEAPIEITWCSFYPPNDDNSPVQQFLEKKFNVKIVNVRIDRSNWQEQFNLKIASGIRPDIMHMENATDLATFVKQGIVAELSADEMRQCMPQYIKSMETANPQIWMATKVDGKVYGVPTGWLEGSTGFLPAYNGAWLQKLGYSEPPKTLDELEQYFIKCRNDDPDGNGKKDTYGMSARGKDAFYMGFNSIFSAFGIVTSFWIPDANGKLSYGMTIDGAKPAFKLLNKWYKEKLIDPEFITEDGAQSDQKFANGRVGYIDQDYWYAVVENGEYYKPFKEKNPNAEIVVGKPLVAPGNSEGACMSWGLSGCQIALGIKAQTDEKLRKKIYEILEAEATDDETYLTTAFGIEGTSYDMVNGIPAPKPGYEDSEKRGASIGASQYFALMYNMSFMMQKYDRSPQQLELKKKYTDGLKTIVSYDTFPVPGASKYPDISSWDGKIPEEFALKFITGELDVDKDWNKWIDAFNKAGGTEWAAEVNKIYDANK